jgi:para-nitrobenzyl esterase
VSEIVETQGGRVRGSEERGVRVYRGIPYAAPTAGEGRWRAPRPAAPWPGVREARRPGPPAPQADGPTLALLGVEAVRASEDCLSLDVWTPGPGGSGRPVLVWIHGGGFVTGSGSLPMYDGAALARAGDAVVVTLGYRLGALGFLSLPELAGIEAGAPANFGLLDQLAALEWVRANAAAFGGDPERVCLFGQSSGAMCIGALLAAPRAQGLFARAILQSGAASNVHPAERAARVTAVFCEELGVSASDGRALRAAPLAAILAAQQRAQERLRGEPEPPAFQPCADGALLPELPLAAFAAGRAARIPLLVGTNRDEWKFYAMGDPKARVLDDAGLLRRFERALPGQDSAGRPWAARAIEAYRAARAGRASVEPAELWFAIQSDRWFRFPALRLAELHAAQGGEVRAYLFDWPSPALGGWLGACHGLEIPFVFGGGADPRLAPFVGGGDEVKALSECMQQAWLDFARGEAPCLPEVGSWPTWERERRATLRLGRRCEVLLRPFDAELAFWEEIAFREEIAPR